MPATDEEHISRERRAFYERYLACCNERRFDDFDQFVADVVLVNGEPLSRDAYARGIRAVGDGSADYRWEIHHVLVDGDWLAVHLVDSGTHTGAHLGIPATGRPIRTHEFGHYRLRDGRIAEVWVTADDLAVLRQLGAWPR
jgi:predicted ester cyclase